MNFIVLHLQSIRLCRIPKRGGYRVIYYVRHRHGVIWMLTMYPKNVTDNIPAKVLRKIRKEIEDA